MDIPRVVVNELRQRDAEAWTSLLREASTLRDVNVREVVVQPLNESGLARYLLTFDGYSDPIPFIGKKTNAREAHFYRDIAPAIPRLVPRCWLHHVSEDWSWIILDDVPNDWPLDRWTADDVEKVIAMLASFHGTFWKEEERLAAYDWLPRYLGRQRSLSDDTRQHPWSTWCGRHGALSDHALHTAGALAPTLTRAAVGLEALSRLGGWAEVVEGRHLAVIADMLDDPLPILQPLRELPVTLLHGNSSLRHWRLTLFNDHLLLDWSHVAVGPAVCDLVTFLEEVRLWQARPGRRYRQAVWPVSEETMIDSYMLRMHVGLSHFNSRAIRQALPAAQCLYLLTTWLPRFADWLQPLVDRPETWQGLIQMSDAELRRSGYGHLVGLEDYLADLFMRFWHASKML